MNISRRFFLALPFATAIAAHASGVNSSEKAANNASGVAVNFVGQQDEGNSFYYSVAHNGTEIAQLPLAFLDRAFPGISFKESEPRVVDGLKSAFAKALRNKNSGGSLVDRAAIELGIWGNGPKPAPTL